MQKYVKLSTDRWPIPIIRPFNLINPVTGRRVPYDGSVIVDTGADLSLCPKEIIGPPSEDPLGLGLRPKGAGRWAPTGLVPGYGLRIEHVEEGLEEEMIVYPPEPWGQHSDQFVLGRDVLNRWHISLRPTDGDLGEFDIDAQDDDPPGPFFSPLNLLSI